MAIKLTWSASLLWERMFGQALELAWLVSKNYCCLSEAIARLISKYEKQVLHFVQAFFVACYFIASRGCYDKDASLWSRVPWYKLVISLGSVSSRFTQPRGLQPSVCKSQRHLHLMI